MSEDRRRLALRLEHRLRSTLMLLQESARRSGSEAMYDLAAEALRRAGGLASAAVPPGGETRPVHLASAIMSALPGAACGGDRGLAASVPDGDLRTVLGLLPGWLGPDLSITLRANPELLLMEISAPGPAPAMEVPEMGEPLIRILVEENLRGTLEVGEGATAIIGLPAA